MKILNEHEVNVESSINRTIRCGQLGVILNDDKAFELVQFTHCHYLSDSGRLSNTFEYHSFNEDGTLNSKRKSYLYRNIHDLSDDAKNKYCTEVVLVEHKQ